MTYVPKIKRAVSYAALVAALLALAGCATSGMDQYTLAKRQAQSQSFAGKASLYDFPIRSRR